MGTSVRSEIVGILQLLREKRQFLPGYTQTRQAMDQYLLGLRKKLLARHRRFHKVHQAIQGHTGSVWVDDWNLMWCQIHGVMDHSDTQVAYTFNGCLITALNSPQGKIFLFRAMNKPYLMVFKSHFFDRFVQRDGTDKNRMEALVRIGKHLCLTHAHVESRAIFKWDEKSLEQFMLIPEGLCLGFCARFPFQEDLLLWEPGRADKPASGTPLALFNTFIAPEMFREDQVPVVEEMLGNSGRFGVL